jgi:5-formyltetrahydrofolate cyclo-ligase
MPNDGERIAAKAALRSRMRQRLTELSSDERESRSKQICERIVRSPELQFGTEKIDLIVVPGSAFSRDGHRLGRGGGLFDRLLADPAAAAYKLGVCFDFQLLESIPIEPHDIVMDTVVTEEIT